MCRENYFIGLTSKSSKNGSELALKINYRNQKQAQRSSQWFSFFLFALAWPTSGHPEECWKKKKQHLQRVGFFFRLENQICVNVCRCCCEVSPLPTKWLTLQCFCFNWGIFTFKRNVNCYIICKNDIKSNWISNAAFPSVLVSWSVSFSSFSSVQFSFLFPLSQHDFPSTPVLFHFN